MNLKSVNTTASPVSSFLLLIVLMLVGSLVGTLLGLVTAAFVTGTSDLNYIFSALGNPAADLTFFRIVQAGSSIGMCVAPPLLLGLVEGNVRTYVRMDGGLKVLDYLLVFILALCSGPIIELVGSWNAQLSLPERFGELERWMMEQEKQLEVITLQILSDISIGGLFANLLVIAVIPAIGEELLFRGALQQILVRWFRNPHVGIWVAAIIFSAIHLQFYGFLPRMLLGALFGYLYYWSNNIWLPIFAHFVNNAGVLITAFVLQKQGKVLEDMNYLDGISVSWYFISFVATAGLLWFLKQRLQPRVHKNIIQHGK